MHSAYKTDNITQKNEGQQALSDFRMNLKIILIYELDVVYFCFFRSLFFF